MSRATSKQPGEGEAPNEAEGVSFEEAAKRLTKIVESLESGELSLEQSLALFEEGVRLSKSAQSKLDRAEKRVEELLGIDSSGKPVTRPFDAG